MFGIRPVKTLFILAVLFLIFLATKNESFPKSKKTVVSIEKAKKTVRKVLTPKDSIAILHYLFHEKIADKTVNCHMKKAKTRFFVACTEGEFIKDTYWEAVVVKKEIKIFARSHAAVLLLSKYKFKELSCDTKKAQPKVEKALRKFFVN